MCTRCAQDEPRGQRLEPCPLGQRLVVKAFHNYEDIIIREVQEGVHLAGTGWASAGNIFCGVKIFFADRPGGIGVYLDPWS